MPSGRLFITKALRTASLCAAIAGFTATAALGQIENHSFEKVGLSSSALQRPDGDIWVTYEQPQDEHDIINRFDVPRLFKTAIVRNNGEHIAGTDRLYGTGNRFSSPFVAMGVQADNKLLLGIETPEFFRLNADGSLDPSFSPQVKMGVYAVVVQPDGKIVVVPELVRLNPDGSKDPLFNSQLANETPNAIALQSSGKMVVAIGSAPYLRRLNNDGSIDPTFVANLNNYLFSILVLPNDQILVRFQQENPQPPFYTFTVQRLNADGSFDPASQPDPRIDNWFAVQNDGKVLAGFREPSGFDFFLGRMNVDGTLDSSYQTYAVGQLGNTDPISAVFVQPDGTILAEVASESEGQQFLRFSSSGVLDPASITEFRIPAPVRKLAAPSDGGLLVSGDFNYVDGAKTGALVRVQNGGDFDDTFHPVMLASTTTGIDLALQENDLILYSLLRTDNSSTSQMRLTPDGNLDPSFALQNLGPHFTVRDDGKIVTSDSSNVVRRLLADGNVDPAFAATQVPLNNVIVGFAIQPDGKLVVAGNSSSIANIHSIPTRAGVFRVNPDGGIDSSFNPPAFSQHTRFNCVATQAGGKILLGGKLDRSLAPTSPNLIRLNNDGSLDNTFNAAPDDTVSAILVESTGKILIGGGFTAVNGQPAQGVVRLEPDGQLDSSFHLDTGGEAVHALARLADGRIAAGGDFGIAASPALPASRLRNISTRMFVDTGDNTLIGGLIITGSGVKKLLFRGIGPSLAGFGINGALEDPNLELRNSNGALLASNDDWQNSAEREAIMDTGIPPLNPKEAAIIATVPANGASYTALVRPARGNAGIGLVEVYDLDGESSSSKLANISTRGNVLTGDNVMIGGFIVTGPATAAATAPTKVVVRALGPSIPLGGVLQDPNLELTEGSVTLATNDDWKQTQQVQIERTAIPPPDDRESAIVRSLQATSSGSPGAYTAIVRGKSNSNGVGLLEIYDVTE